MTDINAAKDAHNVFKDSVALLLAQGSGDSDGVDEMIAGMASDARGTALVLRQVVRLATDALRHEHGQNEGWEWLLRMRYHAERSVQPDDGSSEGEGA